MDTKTKFNLLVSDINSLNGWNSPLEVLSKFNEIRYTLSILQDELIQETLEALKVKENN